MQISCENSFLKDEMESYIKRELRSLGDVEIVDNPYYQFYLSLIVVEGKNKTGAKTGYIHYASLELMSVDSSPLWQLIFKSSLSPKEKGSLFAKISRSWTSDYAFHFVINTPSKEVKQSSEKIVAHFDTQMLEPQRKKRNAR